MEIPHSFMQSLSPSSFLSCSITAKLQQLHCEFVALQASENPWATLQITNGYGCSNYAENKFNHIHYEKDKIIIWKIYCLHIAFDGTYILPLLGCVCCCEFDTGFTFCHNSY